MKTEYVKMWLRYLFISLLSFCVSLAFANLIYSYIEPPQQQFVVIKREHTVRYDPFFGWANKEGSSSQFTTSAFNTHISINNDGMRDQPVGEKKQFRIVVIGDSLVWGWGVEAEERFTDVLEKELNIEILNIASIGYSTVQYYLLLDKALSYNPDMVLVAFTLYNDFNVVKNLENEIYRPYALIKDGELKILGYPIPDYRLYSPLSFKGKEPYITQFALGRLFYFTVQKYPKLAEIIFPGITEPPPPVRGIESFDNELVHFKPQAPQVQTAGQVTDELLKLIKAKLDKKRVPFAIYALDNRHTAKRGDSYIKLLRQQVEPLGIPMAETHNQMGDRAYFIPHESHWTAEGHKHAADILKPHLVKWIAEISAKGKISSDIRHSTR